MPGVSQESSAQRSTLIEFANRFRQPPGPGTELIETPRYRLILVPDFPIPGPNNVSWIRCKPGEVAEVIAEVHRTVAPRHLPLMWTIDPGTEPADLGDRLAAHGILPDGHAPVSQVMILPADARFEAPLGRGVEIRDGLATPEAFVAADRVSVEAFGDLDRSSDLAALERRRLDQIKAQNRRVLLVTVDGEPAASSGLTLYPPHGAFMNGAGVLSRFRGRGLYRTMVARRLEMARDAGAPGVSVWGGPMSAPILTRLGFESVGWRRFYVDESTAGS